MIEQKFQTPIYSISTEMVELPFDEVISALQKADIEIPGAVDDLTKYSICWKNQNLFLQSSDFFHYLIAL